jgi:regulator of PEP synthase PpsR (kinase-PPPase family)
LVLTGESAARTVRAALSQFELCYKTAAPATLLVFRFLEDEAKAQQIIETAASEDALVVYTLVRFKP